MSAWKRKVYREIVYIIISVNNKINSVFHRLIEIPYIIIILTKMIANEINALFQPHPQI